MAPRAPRPCRAAGCSALTKTRLGYCEKHTPISAPLGSRNWRAYHRGRSRQERGYGRAWEKVRVIALHRDGFLCVPCSVAGRVVTATQVDHITPKARGGTDDLANLQSICRTCHAAKTAREGNAAPE